jgi:hypothetical protein
MPARRRVDKRRGSLRGSMGDWFLLDDGVHLMLDPDPREHLYTIFEARSIWETVRVEVWRDPLRDLWPPVAALKYDGITETTKGRRPGRPWPPYGWDGKRYGPIGEPIVWTPGRVREAVEADVASVEAFREAKPAAATEIADELELYVRDLGVLLTISEQHGDELEGDVPHVASSAWSNFENSRRSRL